MACGLEAACRPCETWARGDWKAMGRWNLEVLQPAGLQAGYDALAQPGLRT